jgi:hypothetical protein
MEEAEVLVCLMVLGEEEILALVYSVAQVTEMGLVEDKDEVEDIKFSI